MASKKLVRGAALVKKAIEASQPRIPSPEPVVASILKKLRMPDDEKLPAGLKTFLAHDSSSLGWSFDDEEPEFEPMSLDELVEQELGAEHVPAFGEAIQMLEGDCVLIEGEGEETSFLYVGTPDDLGEYPVISLALDPGGAAKVFGFAPFDVWIAQRYGVVAPDAEEYVPAAQALAESNGDGRRSFESQHRDIAAGGGDDDEEDEDEDGKEDE